MEFDENFFRKEVRSDFEVPAMVKRVWAAEMELLNVFDDICRRRGLIWFADSGTLLGAVRHKGFIPWDDDVDVCMLRPDYDRLLECVEEELPEGYFFSHPFAHQENKTDVSLDPYAKITNGAGINYGEDYLEKNHGCPFSVGLDIFPMAGMPEDAEEKRQFLADFFLLKETLQYLEGNANQSRKKVLVNLASIEKSFGVKIIRSQNVRQQLMYLLEELSRKYPVEQCKEIANYYWMKKQKPFEMKKEWFEDTALLMFEQMILPCPVGYHNVLKVYFGDYMIPVRGGGAHEYPFPFCESMYDLAFSDELPECRDREKVFAEKLDVELYEVKELGLRKSTTLARYYQYFYDGGYYISRIPYEKGYSFLDWEREKDVYEALKGMDITLFPIFMRQDGTKAARLVSDISFPDIDDMEQIAESIELLKVFHQTAYSGKRGASPIDMLRFYEAKFETVLLQYRDITGLSERIKKVIEKWETYVPREGLAHLNLTTKSFIQFGKEGQKEILLLDLKYAGLGDTDWDVAGLAADLFCSEQEIFDLLVLYFSETLSEDGYRTIYEKILLGTCIVAFVRGIQYRLLSNAITEMRKKAFESIKYTKKLLNVIEVNGLI